MVHRTAHAVVALTLGMTAAVAAAPAPAAAFSSGLYLVSSNGTLPAVSGTGRYVAFLSSAALTPDDTNSISDAYVRDVQTDALTRASGTSGATQVDISDDGRKVAFISLPITGQAEAFVRDLDTGALTAVSRSPAGGAPDSQVFGVAISGNGKAVAFYTQATNIVPGTFFGHDVFVRRLDTMAVEVASRSAAGEFSNGTFNIAPQLSYDGRRVGFVSNATNLSPDDTDTGQDPYVKDLDTGAVQVHNLSDKHAIDLAMNAAGTRVAFGTSFISNAFPAGLFFHDFTTDDTSQVSFTPCGSGGRPKMDGSGVRIGMVCSSSPRVQLKEHPSGAVLSAHVANSLGVAVSADGQAFAWEDRNTPTPSVWVHRLTSTDDSPPVVAPLLSPAQPDGDNGWYRDAVTLGWDVQDPDSPVSTVGCDDVVVDGDQGPATYSCTATSDGGTTGPVTVTIKRDATPPLISATVTPGAPDGDHGWYLGAPSVTFHCDDALAGVKDCPDDVSAFEGSAAVTGTARDHAGNTASATTAVLSVDLTAPDVVCPETPVFPIGSVAQLTAAVTDSGSGPASASVTVPVETGTAGSWTASVTGRDMAGRSTTRTCDSTVTGYSFEGFLQPVDNGGAVNVANAGSTVPLKWRVLDAAGAPVTSLSSVRVTVVAHSCSSTAPEDMLEEVATGPSGLQNQGDGYYQFNWATQKSFARTCRTLRLDTGDGVVHTAEFRFR
jgi:Tol biopolymer transport system component